MKRSAGITLAVGAAALLLAAAPAQAGPPSKATGGISYEDAAGVPIHISFNGRGTPAAADGMVNVRNSATGVRFKVDVTCYSQAGDQAQLSGQVTSGDLPAGTHVRLVALDGGTPGSDGDAVRVTRRPAANPAFDCSRPNSPSRVVTSGNLTVHGGDTPATVGAVLGRVAPDELPGDEDL